MENLLVLRLRPQEHLLFEWLDPFDFLSRAMLPDHFALAAAVRGDDLHGDSSAGLLVASVEEKRIVIEWLCTDPERRNLGLGEKLLSYVFDMAERNGKKEVCALFQMDSDVGEAQQYAESYFSLLGFDREEEQVGEWEVDMYDLNECFYTQASRKQDARVVCLEEAGNSITRTAMDMFGKNSEASILFDILKIPCEYDKQISCIFMNKDKPGGLFLAYRNSDICIPVFFFSKSRDGALRLLEFAANKMCQTMPAKGRMRIIYADERDGALLEYLFPGKRIKTKLLVADI